MIELFYLIFSLSLIGVFFLIKSIYESYKSNREFRGDSITDVKWIKNLISSITPREGTIKHLKYDDYMFILDRKKSIKDLYFYKLIALLLGFLISLAIVSTNIYDRYSNSFEINEKLPIEISKDDYKILSDGLVFNDSEEDREALECNIDHIYDTTDRERYESTPPKLMYKYVSNIHDSLSSIVKLSDFLVVVIMSFIGWVFPSLVVSRLFKSLENSVLLEYNDLETIIYMIADQNTNKIIQALEDRSVFFNELFYEFKIAYKLHGVDAYKMFAEYSTFPEEFLRLLRYLDMIDSSGSKDVRRMIEANKTISEDRIFDEKQRLTSKRLGRLNRICIISFILGAARLCWTLFSLML